MKMNAKYAVNTVMLLFIFGSVGYALFLGDPSGSDGTPLVRPAEELIPIVEGVEPNWAVYFFYNDVYCDTCEKLEGYAVEIVKSRYSELLASGVLGWRSLDMTLPANEHYAVEFKLFSKSIVLVELEDGEVLRWQNLEEIWDLVHDKDAYGEYIDSSLKRFMGEG